ncbi:hypothetical protein F0562_015392 [Nyssa sinensis]|uniref:RING-type domain-containing protein n=1 Tax=Nyssa sinensis TaxID=561372 RepID=A0A5J4ZH85_9ASTE|nr:hypothetical protein F0562_015392 [Nyssa sinensis]
MEVAEDPVNFFMSLDRWPLSPVEYEDEGDEETQDLIGALSQTSETCILGFVIVNIVGLQYFSGTISGREMVSLVREPLSSHGPNAIMVRNTRAVEVGYIELSAARVLAPLIDANLISIEGIVPNTPGRGSRFKIPCQVHIFARIQAYPRVRSAIWQGGLHVISENHESFTLAEAEAEAEAEAVVVKEKRRSKDGKSVDEIFKLADENVSKTGTMEALDPPKDVIKSELFLHQKEALGWLVHRENSCELPPFWEERDGVFVNVLTNYQLNERPEPLRGGIFADDMGLGKTLTLLSLIAFDKCSSANVEKVEEVDEEDERLIVLGGKRSKRGRVNKKVTNSRKKHKTEDTQLDKMVKGKSVGGFDSSSNALCPKTTLIVCPPSVFSTWVTQLEEHTRPGKLKVYMYYGERTKDAEELQKYDIVLTTYSTLSSEDSWLASPMKKIEWWRVILDEAHVIKNINAQISRAVTNLIAKRRWVVTGTPIQNGSFDLFSLMAFLRFEPFSIKSYWNSFVQRPLAQGSEKGLSRLQILMATISLRRTKEKGVIGLPPKTIETCFVDLSVEERELYDQMEGEAKSVVWDYISADSLTSKYSTVLGIILRLRQICTDLALCPSDLRSLLPCSNIEDISNNPELLKKMVSMLQDGEDFDCPICISPPTDIVITCCAHIFCRSCILKTLKRMKPCCPLCRRSLSESDLFSSPPESSDTANARVSSSNTSSKVSALLKLLSASRDQNPATKSVIFSQFRKMLVLLEEPLKEAGVQDFALRWVDECKKKSSSN